MWMDLGLWRPLLGVNRLLEVVLLVRWLAGRLLLLLLVVSAAVLV
jgi:hypothetical protein